MSTHYGSFLIGGRWTAPSSGEEIVVVSPNDEQRLGAVAAGVPADIDAAVAAARAAFDAPGGWPTWPGRQAGGGNGDPCRCPRSAQ